MKSERACAQPEAVAKGLLRRHRALVLALVVFALPLPLEAQPGAKAARIGLLTPSSPAGSGHLVEAFRHGFRELGHIEGKSRGILAGVMGLGTRTEPHVLNTAQ
jgi:hypothetical protein